MTRLCYAEREDGDNLMRRAIGEFVKSASNTGMSLHDRNREVYRLLRHGAPVKPDVGAQTETVWLIDWKNPEKNRFAIAEEVTVKPADPKARGKRPDIVLHVNGIALGVLELKRSTVAVGEGVPYALRLLALRLRLVGVKFTPGGACSARGPPAGSGRATRSADGRGGRQHTRDTGTALARNHRSASPRAWSAISSPRSSYKTAQLRACPSRRSARPLAFVRAFRGRLASPPRSLLHQQWAAADCP